MAENRYINAHPAWEDWLGAGLGAAVVASPYFTGDETSTTVQTATTFLGLMMVLVAFAERVQVRAGTDEQARTWEGILLSIFGALIIVQPFMFDYAASGTLRFWHFAL